MDDLSYGNIWKSLGVAMAFAVVGMLLLRHSDEGREAIRLVSVVLGVLVLLVLDRRELRGRNED